MVTFNSTSQIDFYSLNCFGGIVVKSFGTYLCILHCPNFWLKTMIGRYLPTITQGCRFVINVFSSSFLIRVLMPIDLTLFPHYSSSRRLSNHPFSNNLFFNIVHLSFPRFSSTSIAFPHSSAWSNPNYTFGLLLQHNFSITDAIFKLSLCTYSFLILYLTFP